MSVDADKSYANLSLPKNTEQQLSGVDKALLVQLVYGTLTQQIGLDYILNTMLKKPLDTMPVPVRNILRLGAYQLLYLDRIPQSAAVNESVILAHKFGHRGTVSLVNAVLRKVASTDKDTLWPDRSRDLAIHLSTRYAHPLYLVRRYLGRLGVEDTERLLQINNEPPRFSIRVNTTKTTAQGLADEFVRQSFQVEPGVLVPEILYLSRAPSFSGKEFRAGLYIVQGESSALCAHFLGARPGESVVDLCAAPGGKTTHIAELMDDKGQVWAFDSNANRLKLVEQNAERLGLKSIKTVTQPAQQARQTVGHVQRVLLDAPCSGFGVIRHKPDIRLHRQESDIAKLAQLQRELILSAADTVALGGTLVYSVCTTEPEETTAVVQHLLKERADFTLAPTPSLVAERKRDDGLGFLFLPHRDNIDGFYIASFVRAGK